MFEKISLKLMDVPIYLYYGNASATETNATVIWNEYALVCHAQNNSTDASGNGNTGSLLNGTSYTNGHMGKGFSLDGVNDIIRFNNSASLNPSSITLSAMCYYRGKLSSTQDNAKIYCKPILPAADPWVTYSMGLDGGAAGNQKPRFEYSSGGAGTQHAIQSDDVYPTSTWCHVVGAFDTVQQQLECKYASGSIYTNQSASGTVVSNSVYLVMGSYSDNWFGDNMWYGYFDELRITPFGRSSNWIDYESRLLSDLSDSYSTGSEQRYVIITSSTNWDG